MSNNLDNIFRQIAQQHEEEFVQQDWELMQQKLRESGVAASEGANIAPKSPEAATNSVWTKWAVGFVQGFVFMGLISYVVSSVRLQEQSFILADGQNDSVLSATNANPTGIISKNTATTQSKNTKPSCWKSGVYNNKNASVQNTEANTNISAQESQNITDDKNFTKEKNSTTDLRELSGQVADLNTLEGKTTLAVASTPFFAPVEKTPVRQKRRQFIELDKKSTAITINVNSIQQQEQQEVEVITQEKVSNITNDTATTENQLAAVEYVRPVGLVADSTPKTCVQECKVMLKDSASQKQDKAYAKHFLHIGFAPVLSSNGANANKYVNNTSVHAAISQSAGLEGFEVAGVGNITQDYTQGVQIGGVFNVVKKKMKGLQIAGVTNCAGVVSGVQIAGVVNTSCNAKGWQLAGVTNVAGNLEGVQTAGVVNVAHHVKGAQLANVINVAHNLNGVQVSSLINVAHKVNGWQIGLLNFADTVESGGAIGLLGYTRKSHKYFHAWTNPTMNTNVGMRFTHGRAYNIAAIGLNITENSAHKRHALGYGMGIKAAEHGRISVLADFMYFRIGEKGVFSRNVGGMVQGRANIAWRLSRHTSLFVSPSVYLFHSKTENGAELSSLTLFTNKSAGNYQRVWAAINLGFEF